MTRGRQTSRRPTQRQCQRQQRQQQHEQAADAFANAFAPAAEAVPPSQPVPCGDFVQDVPPPPPPHLLPPQSPPQHAVPTPPLPHLEPQRQPRREPRQPLTVRQQYSGPLLHFLSWRDGRIYEKTHQFTQTDLQSITADQIYRWAKFRIYGDPDADEGTVPPQHYRLHSVLGWKRSISYFMPSNHMVWNDAQQEGNPTCSAQLARLTKHMQCFQM